MLCVLCSSMFLDGLSGQHHKTLLNLQKAANAGCSICIAIEPSLTKALDESGLKLSPNWKLEYEFDNTDELSRSKDFPDVHIRCRGTSWGMKFKLRWIGRDKRPASLAEISKQDVENTPWRVPEFGATSKFPPSTGDPAVLELAKKWMINCQQCHSHCDTASPGFYPKRLIDLRNKSPTLIETRNFDLRDPYATLSHCWGQKQFFTLNKRNLGDLMTRIPVEKLPKSFQDAFSVCKGLGIKYLWIDSLCIIQSNEKANEDWLEHARTMADIYKNCLLNIAIDRASNPYQGAFAERIPMSLEPCYVLFSNPSIRRDNLMETIFKMRPLIVDPIQLQVIIPVRDFDSLDEMPLSRRAWVFQERFLSPRVLHFGRDRIFWECRLESNSEANKNRNSPSGPFKPQKGRWEESGGYAETGRVFSTKREYIREEEASDWIRLTERYSSLSLTRPGQDRLVAFGAVAREIEKATKDNYVAGLFRNSLPGSLLWSPSKECSRPIEYQAPSWSWASLNGGCSMANIKTVVAKVLKIDLRYVDEKNRYGMVKSGTLHIRGRITPCLLERPYRDERPWMPAEVLTPVVLPGVPVWQEKSPSASGYLDVQSEYEELCTQNTAFLQITSERGLLLVRRNKDEYVRIGMCETEADKTLFERFEEREIRII